MKKYKYLIVLSIIGMIQANGQSVFKRVKNLAFIDTIAIMTPLSLITEKTSKSFVKNDLAIQLCNEHMVSAIKWHKSTNRYLEYYDIKIQNDSSKSFEYVSNLIRRIENVDNAIIAKVTYSELIDEVIASAPKRYVGIIYSYGYFLSEEMATKKRKRATINVYFKIPEIFNSEEESPYLLTKLIIFDKQERKIAYFGKVKATLSPLEYKSPILNLHEIILGSTLKD